MAGEKVAAAATASAAANAATTATEAARPYLTWILIGLGVLLALALVVGLVWWWRKRRPAAPAAEPRKKLEAKALLRIQEKFLRALPLRYRVAVMDFPTVVVMGPAGAGKTTLIDLEVDWRRQERQFMPSYTSDPLLQIFLGPDKVVHEVSASLLEDDTQEARSALRRLWRSSFRRQRGRVVIALDTRWLAETPPDEVRRFIQLVRGKINLLGEVSKGAVETRLCLTHMDSLVGFEDFAQLLRGHGIPLHWDVPPPGEEGKLASGLQPLEQYFALGLVSLSVEAFGRLEEFYARGGDSFAALARFVTGLWEGGALSYRPELSRVYLSSPYAEARSVGVFAIAAEKRNIELRSLYLGKHLRRCAALLALGCLPVLAAYANFHGRLEAAQRHMADFDSTVQRLQQQHLTASGEVVVDKGQGAMQAMDALLAAKRYWPPLNHSFLDEQEVLRAQLANTVRLSYLKPLMERCQEQCERCGPLIPGCSPSELGGSRSLFSPTQVDERCERETLCRPEQMLHLMAVARSARGDDMGRFLLSSLDGQYRKRWNWAADSLDLLGTRASGKDGDWMQATGLREEVVGDYIISSDQAWRAGMQTQGQVPWMRWPYQWLREESYLGPWRDHLMRLQLVLGARELNLEQWRALATERQRLQITLAQSVSYTSAHKLLALLDASGSPESQATLKGVENTLDALDWHRDHQAMLAAVLRMEEEIDAGLKAAEEMSTAELLTRTGGLFVPANADARIEVRVLQQSFEFRPKELSRVLLDKLLRQIEQGQNPFSRRLMGLPSGAVAAAQENGLGISIGDAMDVGRVDAMPSNHGSEWLNFETDIRPLVDEFTIRMTDSKLSRAEAAQRQGYVLKKVSNFGQRYRQDLLVKYRDYRFTALTTTLASELSAVTQPTSELVAMLREVSTGAGIGPMEGPYYEPLRQELSAFRPVVQLMTPDKDGQTKELSAFLLLVSQLHTEVSGFNAPPMLSDRTVVPAAMRTGGQEAPATAEESGRQLVDLLSPLGRVGLSMLLDEEGSYLRKVDAWLDKQGILGELRRPFREPFLVTRELGRAELERVLEEQWEWRFRTLLTPLMRRYPFAVEASQELDPTELDVLKRKDGAFWQFVNQVLSPVVEERGTEWMLRRPLRQQLAVPPRMLAMLSRLSKLARLLWTEEGKPQPLMLQVRPLPLPPSGDSGFVTMSFLKCGEAASFGFNQTPAWQDFALAWWEPRSASVGVELRVPGREGKRYRSTELSRSSWNCFRILDAATFDAEQNAIWPLPGPDGSEHSEIRLRFGMRGGPWTLFQEVTR
ncbi:type VI secretion IcmF C-terminal domain-containing protein [Myxococcus landrumensis]|uniref:Type VI secretion system component TssM1 helical domain-containing protein n=1 Tax=Myxococcus landrumensis TaxID=2813577 RepID=A0ABX7NFX9_9BACT|nr:type VI secretion IcmF C-terminal domain-containing protein [Myxococcus landrumus]QSQ16462.1 hypothetical protein JY572_10610 [Myxococcus landrumus]